MSLLSPGDAFPAFDILTPGGGDLSLPEALAGDYAVVLFYRGSWCPYCMAQLRAFQRASEDLTETGVRLVAVSVDDEPTTVATIEKHRLTFPVGYGADAHRLRELTGAFVNAEPLHLQSTGFLLDPGGRVVVSVYSSGAIGRLNPEDVIGMVKYLRRAANPEG